MKITDDMLTEWFPANMKPARIGIYECDRWMPQSNHDDYSKDRFLVGLKWNGEYWEYVDRCQREAPYVLDSGR